MASGEFAIASEGWSLRRGEVGKFKHFLAVLPGSLRKILPFVTFSPAEGDKLELHFFFRSGFGAAGEGYFRISAFNSRAKIEQAMQRFEQKLRID